MNDFDLRKYLAENRLLKENKIAQAIRDEAEQEDSKVGAAIFKKYAKKIESASKEDYRKILTSMERELIDTHPDTFDGDDDIVASFMALAENKLIKENIDDLFGEYVAQWSQGNYDYDFAELKPGPVKGSLVDDFTLGPDEYDDDSYARDYKMMRDYLSKNKSYELSQDEKEGLSQFPVQFSLEDDGETIKADIYYSPEYLAMVNSDELN